MRPRALPPARALLVQLLLAAAGLTLRYLYPGQILASFVWVFAAFAVVHLLAGWAHTRQAEFGRPVGQAVFAGLNLAYLLFCGFQSDLLGGQEYWGPQVYLGLRPDHPLVVHSPDILYASLTALTFGYAYVLTQSVMGWARRRREERQGRQRGR